VIRTRRPVDRRSRLQRWHDADAELLAPQGEYAAWLAALPDSLRDTAMAEAPQAIVDLDLDTLASTDPPRGLWPRLIQALHHELGGQFSMSPGGQFRVSLDRANLPHLKATRDRRIRLARRAAEELPEPRHHRPWQTKNSTFTAAAHHKNQPPPFHQRFGSIALNCAYVIVSTRASAI
jgi:hypothetical protein